MRDLDDRRCFRQWAEDMIATEREKLPSFPSFASGQRIRLYDRTSCKFTNPNLCTCAVRKRKRIRVQSVFIFQNLYWAMSTRLTQEDVRRPCALCRWQALAVGTVPLVTSDDAFDQRLYADSGVGGATLGPLCSLPCYPRPCLQITHAVSLHVIRGQSCAP